MCGVGRVEADVGPTTGLFLVLATAFKKRMYIFDQSGSNKCGPGARTQPAGRAGCTAQSGRGLITRQIQICYLSTTPCPTLVRKEGVAHTAKTKWRMLWQREGIGKTIDEIAQSLTLRIRLFVSLLFLVSSLS